jgi:hypothetical protein
VSFIALQSNVNYHNQNIFNNLNFSNNKAGNSNGASVATEQAPYGAGGILCVLYISLKQENVNDYNLHSISNSIFDQNHDSGSNNGAAADTQLPVDGGYGAGGLVVIGYMGYVFNANLLNVHSFTNHLLIVPLPGIIGLVIPMVPLI